MSPVEGSADVASTSGPYLPTFFLHDLVVRAARYLPEAPAPEQEERR